MSGNCRYCWMAAALVAVVPAQAALSCDFSALDRNIDWLRHNNNAAYQKIEIGCRILKATFESGTGLQIIIDGYIDGHSHNKSAASVIRKCTAVDILTACK